MIAHLRNKLTGEITTADQDSPEFVALVEERDGDGFPVYEQTGRHHAAAVEERRENDVLRDEDLGKENEPNGAIVYDTTNLTHVDPSDLDLTPAEVEAGLTPDLKAKQLEEQFGISRSGFASDAPVDTSRKAKKKVAQRRQAKAGAASGSSSSDDKDKEKAGSSSGSSGSSSGS